jgi:L-lactate dehydrogenase (cytochrome)/(S)-mandelate dehydrogenase
MRIDHAVNLEDIREIARRRLPRIAYDFIEGGVEDEHCLERNREAFRRRPLMPRYLVDVQERSQSAELFGVTYSSPFGISPAGVAGLFRPYADRLLAEQAAQANIPFLMSSAACITIEEAARIGPTTSWFQVYGTRDCKILDHQIGRARDAGVRNLVLTVDVPVVPRRERNIRNGFSRPLKLTPARILEGLTHPAWLIGYLRSGGVPLLANWVEYAGKGATKDEVADVFGNNTPASGQTWETLDRIRRMWPGNLIVKGILDPGDARRVADIGANGIIVSNHGGRQIDACPAAVDMLEAVRKAAGDEMTVMLDSGIRRGTDILVSLCLGAKFVFFARPTLYGAAAGGSAGIRKVIDILRMEVDLAMGQIGCADIRTLDASYLAPVAPPVEEEWQPARAACKAVR